MRRPALAAAVVIAVATTTGCAALAEEGWPIEAEPEPVEAVASPSIPEAAAPVGAPEPEPLGGEPSEVEPPAEVADGCITDPIADAVVRWPGEHVDVVTAEELSIWPLADVDGDGRDEAMAVAEVHCGVTGNCPRLLYLSHGGCPRYGGGLWATVESELVLPKVRRGVHDLEVYLKGGCAGMEGTVFRLGWTGERYRVRSTIDCECPVGWLDDEPADPPADAARDPACPG